MEEDYEPYGLPKSEWDSKNRFRINKKPKDSTANAIRRGNCMYVNQSPVLFCFNKK